MNQNQQARDDRHVRLDIDSILLCAHTDLTLFDMRTDSGEKTNVADQYPEVVAGLSKLADGIRGELGDEITGTKGVEIRVAGDVAKEFCNYRLPAQ